MYQEKHKTTPSTLRKVEVEVISTQDCKAHYKDNPVLETMLCATAEGRDSCKVKNGTLCTKPPPRYDIGPRSASALLPFLIKEFLKIKLSLFEPRKTT